MLLNAVNAIFVFPLMLMFRSVFRLKLEKGKLINLDEKPLLKQSVQELLQVLTDFSTVPKS